LSPDAIASAIYCGGFVVDAAVVGGVGGVGLAGVSELQLGCVDLSTA
jgi:hypothetical protein